MLSFRTAVVRETTNALQETFLNHPIEDFRNIYVGPEYPQERLKYPCVVVRFQPSQNIRLGLGHFYSDGEIQNAHHWMFQGTLGFTMMAATTQDRDRLADSVQEIVSWGYTDGHFRVFSDEMYDNDFISMMIMADSVVSDPGQTFPAPWGTENEILYISTHAYPVTGEYYSSEVEIGELVRISTIIIYPYRPDQPEPFPSGEGAWTT